MAELTKEERIIKLCALQLEITHRLCERVATAVNVLGPILQDIEIEHLQKVKEALDNEDL